MTSWVSFLRSSMSGSSGRGSRAYSLVRRPLSSDSSPALNFALATASGSHVGVGGTRWLLPPPLGGPTSSLQPPPLRGLGAAEWWQSYPSSGSVSGMMTPWSLPNKTQTYRNLRHQNQHLQQPNTALDLLKDRLAAHRRTTDSLLLDLIPSIVFAVPKKKISKRRGRIRRTPWHKGPGLPTTIYKDPVSGAVYQPGTIGDIRKQLKQRNRDGQVGPIDYGLDKWRPAMRRPGRIPARWGKGWKRHPEYDPWIERDRLDL